MNTKEKNILLVFLKKINDKVIIAKKINELIISGTLNKLINQDEVIKSIKPKKNLKFNIHSPGVGMNFKKVGFNRIRKYGKENPKAIKEKIKNIFWLDVIAEKPIAVPKKGALQGVAISVANIPDKKYPPLLFEDVILFNLLRRLWGKRISKKPNKFNAKIRIIIVIVNKK